jgi:hypothetical protein
MLAISVSTSLGIIELSETEYALFARLLSDGVSVDEGLAFYNGISARIGRFPPEWEMHVLRAAVLAHPHDSSMAARLAELETALAVPDRMMRLAFERAWALFARLDLVSPREPNERAARLREAIDFASSLLSSPVFDTLTLERRTSIILALHDTLMSVPNPDLPLIADLGLRRLKAMLAEPELTEAQAFGIYDALHSLYFAGASDMRDLRRFDAMVAPFEAWLEQRHGLRARPRFSSPAPGKTITIAYLLHVAHFDRGNAVSPLIASLASMHAERPDRRILLFAVQHIAPDFATEMMRRGIECRLFEQGRGYARMDEIAAAIRAENVDVVITEQNRAIAAGLFTRGVAARQMWLDTGFLYWSLHQRDWTIAPGYFGPADPDAAISGIVLRQAADTLTGKADPAEIAAVKARFPADAFVIGVFARLIKLDRNYLNFLKKLLAAHPKFYLVIGGPGDPALVREVLEPDAPGSRIAFIAGMVNLHAYGPVLHAMCDTFPFVGGNALREIATHGVPVAAKLGTPWDGLLHADRSPELLAKNTDGLIKIVCRLVDDPDFYAAQRAKAFALAKAFAEPHRMIDDVEAAIAATFDVEQKA